MPGPTSRTSPTSARSATRPTPKNHQRWLTATWSPFQTCWTTRTIRNHRQHLPRVPGDPTGLHAPSELRRIGRERLPPGPCPRRPPTSRSNQLLQGANVARSDLYNDYLLRFQGWSTSNELFLGSGPRRIIADLMTSGLTEVPPLPKPVDPKSWIERLLASHRRRGRGCGGGDLGRAGTRLGPLREPGGRDGGEPDRQHHRRLARRRFRELRSPRRPRRPAGYRRGRHRHGRTRRRTRTRTPSIC